MARAISVRSRSKSTVVVAAATTVIFVVPPVVPDSYSTSRIKQGPPSVVPNVKSPSI